MSVHNQKIFSGMVATSPLVLDLLLLLHGIFKFQSAFVLSRNNREDPLLLEDDINMVSNISDSG